MITCDKKAAQITQSLAPQGGPQLSRIEHLARNHAWLWAAEHAPQVPVTVAPAAGSEREAVGAQSIAANAHEALWKHVQEEAAQELCRDEGHDALLGAVGIVLPAEGYTLAIEAEQAASAKNTPPTNVLGAYTAALRYLGEIGDSSDVLLLIEAARANAPDGSSREFAIESAGKSGGAAAVPALVAELKDPSIDTPQDAVRALYLTGSRSAVPVLIRLLPSREWRVSLTAEYGLEVLTHQNGASTNLMKPPPPDTYLKWIRWWKTDGQTATIFKADKCGEIEPLPSS